MAVHEIFQKSTDTLKIEIDGVSIEYKYYNIPPGSVMNIIQELRLLIEAKNKETK
jgi:hypothetical protein